MTRHPPCAAHAPDTDARPGRPLRHRIGLVTAVLLVLGVALFAIVRNEHTLAHGRIVLLELAPVDPRSLMQGDYMALAFALDRNLPVPARQARHEQPQPAPPPQPRFVHLAVDAQGRTQQVGLSMQLPTDPSLIGLTLRQRDGRLSVGPNAFFFQEGTADQYENARWGEFRVDAHGNALLTHLRDEQLQRLGAQRR